MKYSLLNREAVGVLYFRRLLSSIPNLMWNSDANPHIGVNSLAACVITILCRSSYCDTSGQQKFERWEGEFWHESDAISSALHLLLLRREQPVLWMFGKYTLDQMNRLREQVHLPLPEISRSELLRGKYLHHNIIPSLSLMFTFSIDQILNPDLRTSILPYTQGTGHGEGATIGVFEKGQEPLELYHVWLNSIEQGAYLKYDAVLRRTDIAHLNALGWLAPYGHEAGNHAILADAALSSMQLAAWYSERMNLPLLTTEAGAEESKKWELHHQLPSDFPSW